MQKIETTPLDQLLGWKKWSLPAIGFGLGYLAYLLTDGKHGFFFEFLHHAGLFLAAVVAVHFIYELLVKKHERASALHEVTQAVNATVDALFPAFRHWGFYGFSNALELTEIFKQLEKGDELLWLDTYAPSRHVISPQIVEAVTKGAHVKMLALSPDSAVARMRAGEISLAGFSEKQFIGDLSLFIETMRDSTKGIDNGTFELRLYADLPCVPMYIHRRNKVPLRGLTGYFLGMPSEHSAHILWTFAPGGMLESFTSYFDCKWNNAGQVVAQQQAAADVPASAAAPLQQGRG